MRELSKDQKCESVLWTVIIICTWYHQALYSLSEQVSHTILYHFISNSFTTINKVGWALWSLFSSNLNLATQNQQISVIAVLKKCITNDTQNWNQWEFMQSYSASSEGFRSKM